MFGVQKILIVFFCCTFIDLKNKLNINEKRTYFSGVFVHVKAQQTPRSYFHERFFISVDSAFRMQSKHNDILGTKKTHQTRINQNSREPFCLSHPFEYILFSHCNTAHSRPYLLLLCRCACGDNCY